MSMSSFKKLAGVALSLSTAVALLMNTPATALSSGLSSGSSLGSSTVGSSGSSSFTSSEVLSSGSSMGSLSSGESLISSAGSSLLDRLFPETEEEFLARILNPLDNSYIPIHPVLNDEIYSKVFEPPRPGGRCPAVTAVVARGSGQNLQIRPTRYSPEAPWTSNGFEERNIRALFARLEQHHVAETGESLMKDVYVMGLTDIEYPALLPLSAEGSTALDFGSSLVKGRENIQKAITRFEVETGCQSKYLLVGYSQGVLVIDGQEQPLIDRDQYVGSLLVANPQLDPGDPTIIGHTPETGGLISSLSPPEPLHPHKINYCIPADVVCDRALRQFSASGSSMAGAQLSTGNSRNGRTHLKYFVTDQPWDEEVFDQVSGWITGAVDGSGEIPEELRVQALEETEADLAAEQVDILR